MSESVQASGTVRVDLWRPASLLLFFPVLGFGFCAIMLLEGFEVTPRLISDPGGFPPGEGETWIAFALVSGMSVYLLIAHTCAILVVDGEGVRWRGWSCRLHCVTWQSVQCLELRQYGGAGVQLRFVSAGAPALTIKSEHWSVGTIAQLFELSRVHAPHAFIESHPQGHCASAKLARRPPSSRENTLVGMRHAELEFDGRAIRQRAWLQPSWQVEWKDVRQIELNDGAGGVTARLIGQDSAALRIGRGLLTEWTIRKFKDTLTACAPHVKVVEHS